MKPNFNEMSVPELRAYVLAHRDDDEAIRALFHHPSLKWKTMPPLVTTDGLPIEENIRIAEEAIRQQAERDIEKQREKELQKERELEEKLRQKIEKEVEARLRQQIEQEKVNFRKNMTTVTQEEIEQFREQLSNNLEANTALDVIQECEGNLEDAVTLLMMRETGKEPDRGVDEWLQKCRQVICKEEVKEALESGLIAPAIEPLAISMGLPPGTATALGILAFKIGVKKFCDSPKSES